MKLKHGIVYSSSSGNLGGSIVQSGSHGSTLYMRTRKKVGMSNKQSQRRAAMLRITSAWRTLRPSVVKAYNHASKSIIRSSFDGSVRTFTGYQLFFYVNYYRLLSGFTLATSFSFYRTVEYAHPYRFSIIVSLSRFNFYFNTVSPIQQRVLVFATRQFNTSVRLKDSDYLFIISWWVDNPSPFNIYNYYKSVFPAPLIPGSTIYLKCVQICSLGLPVYPTLFTSVVIT